METDERTNGRTDERTKIKNPGVGRTLLGPAKNMQDFQIDLKFYLVFDFFTKAIFAIMVHSEP